MDPDPVPGIVDLGPTVNRINLDKTLLDTITISIYTSEI